MNQTSLDNPGGAADDGHIARIVRLETQMDNVTSALVSLQRAQEAHHQAMLAGFESLRDKLDELREDTNVRFDATTQRFNRSLTETTERFDRSLAETAERFDRSQAEAAARFERSQAAAVERFERSIDRQDKRIDYLGNRIDHLESRIDYLSHRIDRLVYWMAGLMITNVVTVVGLLLRATGTI
ncbi:hypothetical protein [Duganella levis]|uniref:DUF1640 domain-containing protein n=1 Tax=Duganella levis TaxID=2692169 RepID=A0ABW9W140_9BURK|nr:hypothetical protein [Duganella levis]MYN27663.1 hypothetical protein [Duganella levis]